MQGAVFRFDQFKRVAKSQQVMDITQASKKEALRRKCDVLWFWSLKSLARPKLLPRLGKPHIASPCASDVVEAPCIAFALRSLFQEGRLLGSLRHPFVVRYRDSFCEALLCWSFDIWTLGVTLAASVSDKAGVLCIIMNFCEGTGVNVNRRHRYTS